MNRTNFVSLVVDTRGSYVAAITRRVEVTTIYTPHSEASYPFFCQKEVPIQIDTEESAVEKKKYIVEQFPLTVIRHEISSTDEYMDRFATLIKPMLGSQQIKSPTTGYKGYQDFSSITPSQKQSIQSTPSSPYYGGMLVSSTDMEKPLSKEEPSLFPCGEDDEYEDLYSLPQATHQYGPEVVGSYDEWEEAEGYKNVLHFDKELFGKWMLMLLSGTPLKALTQHLVWGTASGDRLMNMWRETFAEDDANDEFSVFMSEWVPYCINALRPNEYFLEDDLKSHPGIGYDELTNVFFLYIRDAIKELTYDTYTEELYEILKEEFAYYPDED